MVDINKMQTPVQSTRLQEIELELEDLATIATKLFRRAGQLIGEIRDSKLYRDAGYSTFEAYIRERWHMKRARAYQLIDAALAVSDLAEHFQEEELPLNESVVRSLVPLEPEEQVEIWHQVPPIPQRKDVASLVKAYKIVGAYPLIGSKWKMSQVLAARAKEIHFEKYLEPFVGSGAIFFRFVDEGLIKKPAVLNDLNQFAVSLLRAIREQPDELQKRLMLVPNARIERSEPEPSVDADELEQAVWWAVHTYQGYVGHDTKSKGWSVDHSSHAGRHNKWNKFKQQIPAMGKILCDFASLECMDALQFIKKYTSKSDCNLLCVDPPYFGHEATYRAFFKQHAELAELLTQVPAAGVFVTYYDCDQLRQLYPESSWHWELFDRQSTCTFNGVGQRRTEVLLTRKERILTPLTPSVHFAAPAQQTAQQKSRAESLAEQIRAQYEPGEIQQLISLLKT